MEKRVCLALQSTNYKFYQRFFKELGTKLVKTKMLIKPKIYHFRRQIGWFWPIINMSVIIRVSVQRVERFIKLQSHFQLQTLKIFTLKKEISFKQTYFWRNQLNFEPHGPKTPKYLETSNALKELNFPQVRL